MEASSLLAQELWNEILDHLHESKKDLLSSALVCRAFVDCAQRHLFNALTIDAHPRRFVYRGHRAAISGTRLAALLSSSPHLIDYICALRVDPCNAETMTPLVRIAWSRISAITLVQRSNESLPALTLIETLVSLPTLRKIVFHGDFQTNHLRSVLSGCTPFVTSLTFRLCGQTIEALPTGDDLSLPISSSHQHPSITHLGLDLCPTIPEFLMSTACPLDLSRLRAVKYEHSRGRGFSPFLYFVGRTIQTLDIETADLKELDMRRFPRLSHITVHGPPQYTIKRLVALQRAFERCCQSTVNTICYPLEAEASELLPDLETIQTVILSAEPRALRRMEVEVTTREHSRAEWTALIQSRMLQLAERGILEVTFR